MATKCHKSSWYLLENFGGVLTYRMEGRRKIYLAQCARCHKSHDLSAREAAQAIKENKEHSP